MAFDLCRCKASNSEGIVIYFEELVTPQMCKAKVKRLPKYGYEIPDFGTEAIDMYV